MLNDGDKGVIVQRDRQTYAVTPDIPCGVVQPETLRLKFDGKYRGMALPGKFKIGISGCPHQCAETCIKDIGLVGTVKGWRLLVGGNGGARPRLAQELARDLTEDQALQLVDTIIAYYKANAGAHKRLGAMIEKVGLDEFRGGNLGPEVVSAASE
ncbi:MAG: hypothetical protein JSW27_25070 [Phycisphaerales bacterium]|nr:MAG: hypothetical protein JSW27_25070 [Phycisphaerales bacterium]